MDDGDKIMKPSSSAGGGAGTGSGGVKTAKNVAATKAKRALKRL